MYTTIKKANNNLGLSSLIILLVIFTAFLFKVPAVQAAGTPAGTTVSNQATADYVDPSGETYNSTSNLVDIVVDAVYSLTLDPSSTNTTSDVNAQLFPGQRQNATAGNFVYYPYTLTNTGNSPDSFSLVKTFGLVSVNTFNPVGTGTGGINGVLIYNDANGNGVIDVGDLLVSGNVGPITPDGQLKLIVTYQVPGTAATNQIANVDLQATSVGDISKKDTLNYSKTTVVNDAVITVAKSVDKSTADPSSDLTYSFTIANTGNRKAEPVVITDAVPTNTQYIVGSELTVANSTFTVASVLAGPYAAPTGTIGTVDPNVKFVRFTYSDTVNGFPVANTRNVSFKVKINSIATNVNITNFATFEYTGLVLVTGSNTNIVSTLVSLKSAAQISFSGSPFTPQTTGGTENPSTDTTTLASTAAGTYVYFKNVVTNNGNAPDTFNITLSTTTLVGSTATFYFMTDPSIPANNTSPLLDTNNDSIIDTGPIPGPIAGVAQSMTIITRVFVPANASAGGIATIQAESTNGGSANGAVPGQVLTDITKDAITAVVAASELFRNVVLGVPAVGTVTLTESANGATVSFPLNISNSGSSNDTFNLSAAVSGIPGAGVLFYQTATQTTLSVAALAGATSVTLTSATGFIAGDKIIINGQTLTVGSVSFNVVTFSSGQTLSAAVPVTSTVVEPVPTAITSTGLMATGTNQNLIAVVTIPAGSVPYSTANNITFTATSTNNNSTSVVTDSLIVPLLRSFTLDVNRRGSVSQGGVLFYDHIITNTGNTPEIFNLSVPSPGPKGLIYVIQDGATSAVISVSPSVAVGTTYTFRVKVIAPGNVAVGQTENAVITAQETTSLQSLVNYDMTTVVNSFITLVKTAANITTGGPGTNARPNDVIEYTITYTNVGSVNALLVKIMDKIPTYTTYVANSLVINGVSKTDLADGETAPTADYNASPFNGVTFNIGTVTPGTTGFVRFRIRFN